MAGDVLSVESFVERVFDRSPKFPRRFSRDGTAVEGTGGGREEPPQCAYMLPSSLDKIVDEDAVAREEEEEEEREQPGGLSGSRGAKGGLRIAGMASGGGGGGKENGSRRRSTSGSPSSEWGLGRRRVGWESRGGWLARLRLVWLSVGEQPSSVCVRAYVCVCVCVCVCVVCVCVRESPGGDGITTLIDMWTYLNIVR